MNNADSMRISELLLRCYDGVADREDWAALEALLDQDPQAQRYYIEVTQALNYFHCLAHVPLSSPGRTEELNQQFVSQLGQQQQMDLLCDFAEYEKHAAAIEIARSEEPVVWEPIKPVYGHRPVRKLSRFSWVTATVCAAAVILLFLYLRFAPPAPYEVATVCDSVGAKWSLHIAPDAGTRLTSNSDPIQLIQGIVKLRTDDQVEVVIEAPSEFYFSSYSEISMNYGKLFAHVSEQGYGFSVVTPNSKVVDLGTEFGVLSHIDGNTEVHLYKGKANVFAGEKHEPKISQLLVAGSAIEVDSHDSNIQDIQLDEQALVRDIDSKANFIWKGQRAIRLADLLLGGNGFGTATRESIEYDPATGTVVPSGTPGYRSGSGKLQLIRRNPYLDGIFIPGSGQGDVPVTSEGHSFKDCPATTGMYYSNVICLKNCTFFDTVQQDFEQTLRQFKDSGFLYFHSNMGLTIDLAAIRHAAPGLEVCAFSAYAGILDLWNNEPDYSDVDVWVLVDGKVRFQRQQLQIEQGCDIRVALSGTDRFLSLVVTDGGQAHSEGNPANHFDTCGFAEPVFEVVSSD